MYDYCFVFIFVFIILNKDLKCCKLLFLLYLNKLYDSVIVFCKIKEIKVIMF